MKPYPRYIIDTARQLRQRMTPSEKLLWEKLRQHQLDGLKFKRQHHIGRYIVDFFCGDLKLIVELEGEIHNRNDQKEYDEQRFAELEVQGYRVLRIKNEDVITNVEDVLRRILEFKKPSPSVPLPNWERDVTK